MAHQPSTRRRQLLVAGSASLGERIRNAGVPDCDVLHAAGGEDARRLLAAHPALALLVLETAAVDAALLPALKAERPGLWVLLLTSDHALAHQAAALALGEVPALLPADAPAPALRAAIEDALRGLAHGRRPGSSPRLREPPGQAREVRDAAAGWPEAAPGDTIDLRAEWLQVVAHDLRTPLGINIGYAALLLDQGAFDLPPEARELVQHMRANGEWMLELVDGILELATLRAAPPPLRYEPVTPGEILDAVAERMRGLAEPKGVRITRTRLRTARPYALDRMRIEQVLHNLVANAIRFSRPGGAVHLGVRKAGSALAFRVRDTGRGMTREEAASAFSKFAAPGGGHGLGLAIARAIVELHGGRISVRTEPGRGSTFIFTVVPGQDGP